MFFSYSGCPQRLESPLFSKILFLAGGRGVEGDTLRVFLTEFATMTLSTATRVTLKV